MAVDSSIFLKDHLEVFLLFFILALASSFIALILNFYLMPDASTEKANPVFFKHVFLGFLIYLCITLLIAPLYAKWIMNCLDRLLTPNQKQLSLISWVNITTIGSAFISLTVFAFSMRRDSWIQIWKRNGSSYSFDILLGFLGWFVALPVVVCINQLLEILVYLISNVMIIPEQVAVQFLKMTVGHPFYFFLALISVLFFAPAIEEFLFRGLLQNWSKRLLNRKIAIVFSALCFSLFHFSPAQKLGNIPIIGSLFVFACFLGFVYERQKSLLSSITLHATFNALSVFNLIFFT